MLSLNYFSYSYSEDEELAYNRCNRKSDALPLVINCAGVTATAEGYRTHNPKTRNDWYLLYVRSGSLFVKHEDRDLKYGGGTFIIFHPGQEYHYYHKAGEPIECYWIHFTGSDAENSIIYYGLKVFPEINMIKHDTVIDARYSNIFNTFVQNDKFRDREQSILLDRLLLSLAKRTSGSYNARSILNRSINFINENYNTQIYISDLAALESLSLSRYNVIFKQATGMSPCDYIKQLRLSAACELLTSTELPVNVISESVGYDNQCFFSKIFKKTLGVTPTEYRQNK